MGSIRLGPRTRPLSILGLISLVTLGCLYLAAAGRLESYIERVGWKNVDQKIFFNAKPRKGHPAHPTRNFRDSLDPSTKYVTAFLSAGLTNQIISNLHLIQLAQLSGRTAILAPFAPATHVSLTAGFLPFSKVFDLEWLEKELGITILEWNEIKDTSPLNPISEPDVSHSPPTNSTSVSSSPSNTPNAAWTSLATSLHMPVEYVQGYFGGSHDSLGCWSLTMNQSPRGDGPRHGELPSALSLDVSWTPVPFEHKANPRHFTLDLSYLSALGEKNDSEATVAEVGRAYLEGVDRFRGRLKEADRERFRKFTEVVPTRVSVEGVERQFDPEDQVLCYDYLFYSAMKNSNSTNIIDESIDMAIDDIGVHMRFSNHLESIAQDVFHAATHLPAPPFSPSTSEKATIDFPPYIAVHIRRGDFGIKCHKPDPIDGCFTPLSTYVHAVESVRSSLLSSPKWSHINPNDIPVILFSDEPRRTTDGYLRQFHRPPGSPEAFWTSVAELGWYSVDPSSPELKAIYEEKNLPGGDGGWYPPLVDSVIMANAVGFVGTDKSTFSIFAGKRVKAWSGGVVKTVVSGTP